MYFGGPLVAFLVAFVVAFLGGGALGCMLGCFCGCFLCWGAPGCICGPFVVAFLAGERLVAFSVAFCLLLWLLSLGGACLHFWLHLWLLSLLGGALLHFWKIAIASPRVRMAVLA